MANNDFNQSNTANHDERETRLAELENVTGKKIDRGQLDAAERDLMAESLGNVEECLRKLQDVQAGLDLILKLHTCISASEEGAFFNVLDILSAAMRDHIERSIELIV